MDADPPPYEEVVEASLLGARLPPEEGGAPRAQPASQIKRRKGSWAKCARWSLAITSALALIAIAGGILYNSGQHSQTAFRVEQMAVGLSSQQSHLEAMARGLEDLNKNLEEVKADLGHVENMSQDIKKIQTVQEKIRDYAGKLHQNIHDVHDELKEIKDSSSRLEERAGGDRAVWEERLGAAVVGTAATRREVEEGLEATRREVELLRRELSDSGAGGRLASGLVVLLGVWVGVVLSRIGRVFNI